MPSDREYIKTCLKLAAKGKAVAPNPMVGSIIVHDDKIIGKGFHEQFGGPHAEVNAISSVANPHLLKSSSLYVNLEPCCHFGKTPPCVDLIVESEIPKVVIGAGDPDCRVCHKGIMALKEAGIDVVSNVLPKECIELNKRFYISHSYKRPYIILKWAETADGFIARKDYSSKWISCEASRTLVHQWRSEEAAVMVGTNTAFYDDPELTVRLFNGRNPIRVVIDKTGRLSEGLKLFDGSVNTFVFTQESKENKQNLNFFRIDSGKEALNQILKILFQQDVQSLIVEGGSTLLSSFIEAYFWDEARVFQSRKTFGSGISAPTLNADKWDQVEIGEDLLRTTENHWLDDLLTD